MLFLYSQKLASLVLLKYLTRKGGDKRIMSRIAYMRVLSNEEAAMLGKIERLKKKVEWLKVFRQTKQMIEKKIKRMPLKKEEREQLLQVVRGLKGDDLNGVKRQLREAEKEYRETFDPTSGRRIGAKKTQ